MDVCENCGYEVCQCHGGPAPMAYWGGDDKEEPDYLEYPGPTAAEIAMSDD